jgi:hypothetical protein
MYIVFMYVHYMSYRNASLLDRAVITTLTRKRGGSGEDGIRGGGVGDGITGVKGLFFVLAQPKKHLDQTGPPVVALLICKRSCNIFLDFSSNCDFSHIF